MGFKIRQLRKEKGLTQEELAQKSGVSRATIIGLENGTICITTTATLIKIATALGEKVGNIFLD